MKKRNSMWPFQIKRIVARRRNLIGDFCGKTKKGWRRSVTNGLLQYNNPILDPIGRAANGEIDRGFSAWSESKDIQRMRGLSMRRVWVGRNGEDYVPRRLLLRAPAIWQACPFPHSRAARCQRVGKVWKKEDELEQFVGVGVLGWAVLVRD